MNTHSRIISNNRPKLLNKRKSYIFYVKKQQVDFYNANCCVFFLAHIEFGIEKSYISGFIKTFRQIHNGNGSLSIRLERRRLFRCQDSWFPDIDIKLFHYIELKRKIKKKSSRRDLEKWLKDAGECIENN